MEKEKLKAAKEEAGILSQFIEERYESVIREYEEQHQKDQEQLKSKDKLIEKYEKLIKENGLALE